MKTLFAAAGAIALLAAAAPALAQQVSPVTDDKAAAACAPKDIVESVACFDKYLKPEAKAQISGAKDPDALIAPMISVGLWARNNWGLWSGSDLSQYLVMNKVPQPMAMGERLVQAVWLKTKGCTFDLNNTGYIVAAVNKAVAGGDACSTTMAEARTAGATIAPYGRGFQPAPPAAPGRAAAAGAAAGRAGRGAAAAAAAADDADDNPNQ